MNNFDTRSATFALMVVMIGIEALRLLGVIPTNFVYSTFGLYQGAPEWAGVSYALIHGGILHIGFNMLAFTQLGPPLERSLGVMKFLLFSLIAGVLAGFGGLWLRQLLTSQPALIVGYSGVLFAYLGLIFRAQLARSANWQKTALDLARRNPILIALIVVPLIFPIGIAGEAHLIGLAFGLIAAPYFLR